MRKPLSQPRLKFGNRADQRSQERHTLVLRLGVLENEGGTSFCLLKDISPKGVQVKLYADVPEGATVCLRVGDENPLKGRVEWVRNGNAGITFEKCLEADALLRVRQVTPNDRRRSSPRVIASARATLRASGRTYSVDLLDISASGAKIRTRRPIELGGMAILDLRHLLGLRTHVRWTDGLDYGLAFEPPIPIQIIAGWLDEQTGVFTKATQHSQI
jgi:hypothetical protein